MLTHRFIHPGAGRETSIDMEGDEVLLIAELPHDADITVKNSKIMCKGSVVAWK